MKSPHYLTVDETSLQGEVYIIGDVHGTAELFSHVLEKLSPNDILIVAGDLIDRGETTNYKPTSALVLDQIIAQNQQADAPKIYAIRGNHEEDFLAVMASIRALAQEKQEKGADVPMTPEMRQQLIFFIANGGGWIFNTDEKTSMAFRNFTACKKEPYQSRAIAALDSLFKQGDPLALLIPKCNAYEDYIQSLPYIIKLDAGDHQAVIVHADLPLSKAALDDRIATGTDLTKREIYHITGARVSELSTEQREESETVYCGHNIIDEEGAPKKYPTLPVRASSRHVNLDCGSFASNAQLLVNHTQHTVGVVGTVAPYAVARAAYAQHAIQDYLDATAALRPSAHL